MKVLEAVNVAVGSLEKMVFTVSQEERVSANRSEALVRSSFLIMCGVD